MAKPGTMYFIDRLWKVHTFLSIN